MRSFIHLESFVKNVFSAEDSYTRLHVVVGKRGG